MSDPVDLDTMAAEARAALEACREHSPAPWVLNEGSDVIFDGDGLGVGTALFSAVETTLALVARNTIGPILNDRDRLKAEVAALEGILSDLSSESYQVQRIRELEARVKVLEEALRPFAEWAKTMQEGGWNPADTDALGVVDGRPVWGVTVADLRRAAKVMEGRI